MYAILFRSLWNLLRDTNGKETVMSRDAEAAASELRRRIKSASRSVAMADTNFIDSPFSTRQEYEAWLKLPSAAERASTLSKAAADLAERAAKASYSSRTSPTAEPLRRVIFITCVSQRQRAASPTPYPLTLTLEVCISHCIGRMSGVATASVRSDTLSCARRT